MASGPITPWEIDGETAETVSDFILGGSKITAVERFDTYIITGERGSRCICLNGAAARKVQVGDTVIIMAYAQMDFEEAKNFRPSVVFPENNQIKI